jgi:twitching motility protein PilT
MDRAQGGYNMEEPIFAVPAFDANGMPLQPPEQGRRRDSLPQRPRRAETSVFAPNVEFTMTTPLAEQAATMHAAPQVHSLDDAAPAPVYQIPLTDLQPPAPVYELPIDAPAPSWDSVPPASQPVPQQAPRPAAPQVYDVSAEAPSEAALLSTAPPPAAAFRVPAFDPPAADSAFDVDEPVAAGEASGDLLAALREVLFRGASDLHISSGAPPMLRIDGALGPIADGKPWSREVVKETLMGLLSPYERERFESTLELDFAYTLTANARFRVNYYQDRGAMSAAFRIIPNEVKQLAQLGIPEVVSQFAALPRGLVLVTGPTGSGKSTTLAALIDIVNSTRTDHIMTVEDPIEFLHRNKKSLVHQREVGRDTQSFSSALKHVLRQDPDVILIGELRDLETISTALTAAETGHLVFATLHTQDAAQTIDRIIDVYPPHQQMQIRSQLASTLQGIVCQTLVKRATGVGRVVAAEVLMMTPAIGNLIREGKTFQIGSAMQAGRAQGMSTLDQHLAELVNAGTISRQSAIDKARDIAAMSRMITRVDLAEQSDGSFGSFASTEKAGI